jgi:two-component system sensor histidine kinase HydH
VDCLGRELTDLFGGEAQIANALRGVADGGEERVELFYSRPDQRSLELGMTVLRVAEHAPAEMTFVTLFRDLGDGRQIDMEMRRVERLTAAGNMVAGFAHEIRSPLAGMQALCEALNAETPPEDVRHEYATRMLTLLERVEAFVRASLQFGEPKPSKRARHRPDALLEAALASLAPRWGRRGSPPPTRISGPLPDIEVDDAQVAECLLALIENALDAAGETALVELAVRGEAGRDVGPPSVCFEVIDRGPGIPAQLLGRIFDPFYTTKPRGTGLGLPLAQRLVRENGGRLSVESTPGRGTTFRMHLPGVEA